MPAELVLNRLDFTDQSTVGELLVDGSFKCYTLEDTCRDVKIDHETAIPSGEYEVTITYSTKFHKDLPLLIGVPGFSGVRIHSGNQAKDTSGCILVGKERAPNWVGRSHEAMDELMPIIEEKLKKNVLSIMVLGGRGYM